MAMFPQRQMHRQRRRARGEADTLRGDRLLGQLKIKILFGRCPSVNGVA
jgi:hypothetical protein